MRSRLLENLSDSLTIIVRKAIANSDKHSVCVSPALDKTLLIVGLYEGIRIKELASILHITSGAATQGVINLEGDGWLTRSPNPDDHRETIVRLTAKGKSALQKIQAIKLKHMAELFAVLDEDELRVLVGLITKASNATTEGVQA